MSRYRKIDVRIWADENFRSLSPIPPCGQGLWFFLLTGPFTGPIPGLFRAGRAAMAEELRWPQKAFDKAFQEALLKGMVKADFEAPLIWLPKALKYNKPESPNVITSWGAEFETLPECDLLYEALIAIRANIYELGDAFIEAFDKAFGKAIDKAMAKAMPNQEQEQEQEQEQNKYRRGENLPSAEPSVPSVIEKVDPLYGTIKSVFEKVNGNFTNYAKEGAAIKRIIKLTNGDREAIEIMIKTFSTLRQSSSSFWSGQPFTPSALAASGIWDRVKEEAKRQIAEQSEDETFARFEAEDRAREAREREGVL